MSSHVDRALLKVRVLTSDGTMDTVHDPSQNALSDCVLECFLAAGSTGPSALRPPRFLS